MARKLAATEERFRDYLERLFGAIGHADRREPLRAYVAGLLLPGERKSVEPMAAKLDPRNVESRHRSMHHFVAQAPWDARKVMRVARDFAVEQFDRHGPIEAWVIDDTGIPKKGRHSVGVARQYCGVLGKQDNCQVAVTISLVNDVLSVPAAHQLYLPEVWAKDRARRRIAGVPDEVKFRPKWQIALDEIDGFLADGVPVAPAVTPHPRNSGRTNTPPSQGVRSSRPGRSWTRSAAVPRTMPSSWATHAIGRTSRFM